MVWASDSPQLACHGSLNPSEGQTPQRIDGSHSSLSGVFFGLARNRPWTSHGLLMFFFPLSPGYLYLYPEMVLWIGQWLSMIIKWIKPGFSGKGVRRRVSPLVAPLVRIARARRLLSAEGAMTITEQQAYDGNIWKPLDAVAPLQRVQCCTKQFVLRVGVHVESCGMSWHDTSIFARLTFKTCERSCLEGGLHERLKMQRQAAERQAWQWIPASDGIKAFCCTSQATQPDRKDKFGAVFLAIRHSSAVFGGQS